MTMEQSHIRRRMHTKLYVIDPLQLYHYYQEENTHLEISTAQV